MPHCIIEYSQELAANVDPGVLVDSVHAGAINSALFEEHAIKSRAIAYQYFRSGVQPQSFVHVTLRILSGRTLVQRKALSESVLSALTGLGLKGVSLTVAVEDMERESYAKVVVGPE
ncbi:5-carboxymethyl-2-hydroxymuconate Delta-isomerase [Aestuariirhabdus sp. LZHN29]|uniref:5-carboxymethyl-2-hydroxymuconate Delta-isomerase n=1 Tax=Aestuariirhabdus sp. LZHN29 TaxID=3417462 RepID=UPI003CFB29FA